MNVCDVCGKLFQPKRHTTGKFCGRYCAWVSRGGAAFNARIARESAGKRGDGQRGSGRPDTYVKMNGRHQHRVVIEKKLGRRLRSDEVVHHIDGNPHNNRLKNLVVLTRAAHMREHGIGIPGMKLHWKPWKFRRRAA